MKHIMDPITTFTLEIWDNVVRKYKLERERSLLSWIAYDPKFKPGIYDLRFKHWTEKGVIALCTILKDGTCMSFQDSGEVCGKARFL